MLSYIPNFDLGASHSVQLTCFKDWKTPTVGQTFAELMTHELLVVGSDSGISFDSSGEDRQSTSDMYVFLTRTLRQDSEVNGVSILPTKFGSHLEVSQP